jgi:hypothetical protein
VLYALFKTLEGARRDRHEQLPGGTAGYRLASASGQPSSDSNGAGQTDARESSSRPRWLAALSWWAGATDGVRRAAGVRVLRRFRVAQIGDSNSDDLVPQAAPDDL